MSLTACAVMPITTPDGHQLISADQLETYVKTVFWRQHRASQQIVSLLADDELIANDALMDAETVMNQSCEPIVKIATKMSEQQQVNLSLKLKAKATVKDCDTAVSRVENLLKHVLNDVK